MRKQTLKVAVLGFLGLSFGVFAQTTETPNTRGKVGINTIEPYATLQINAKKTADGANGIDGFLPPRLTGAELMNMTKKLKDAKYDGLIVYVTKEVQKEDWDTLTETEDQWVKYAMHKVSMAGYYRYNYITNTGGLDDATATGLGGSFLHRVGSWVRLEPTGLEVAINPNDPAKVGRRLMGVNTANYGPIGNMAVDMSHQTATSTTRGATGDYALALGQNTTASGVASMAMGESTVMGDYSFAIGTTSIANGKASVAFQTNKAYADYSVAFGNSSAGIDKDSKYTIIAGGVSGSAVNSPYSFLWGATTKATNSKYSFSGGGGAPTVSNAENGILLSGTGQILMGKGTIVSGSIAMANGDHSISLGGTTFSGVAKIGLNYEPGSRDLKKQTKLYSIQNGRVLGNFSYVLSNNSVAIGYYTKVREDAPNSIAIGGGATVDKEHYNSIVITGRVNNNNHARNETNFTNIENSTTITTGPNQIVIGNDKNHSTSLAPLTSEDNFSEGGVCYRTTAPSIDYKGKIAYKEGVGLLGCVNTTWVKLGN